DDSIADASVNMLEAAGVKVVVADVKTAANTG
ncbi:MAG: hypothetical protein ACJAZF_004653, partial [Granulosicoccus sp.]